MPADHRKAIRGLLESLQGSSIKLEFNNLLNGEFIKNYATELTINGCYHMRGLQSWNKKDFSSLSCLLQEALQSNNINNEISNIINMLDKSKNHQNRAEQTARTSEGLIDCYYIEKLRAWKNKELLNQFYDYIELLIDEYEDMDMDIEVINSIKREKYIKLLKSNNISMLNININNVCELERYYIACVLIPLFIKNTFNISISSDTQQKIIDCYFCRYDLEEYACLLHDVCMV